MSKQSARTRDGSNAVALLKRPTRVRSTAVIVGDSTPAAYRLAADAGGTGAVAVPDGVVVDGSGGSLARLSQPAPSAARASMPAVSQREDERFWVWVLMVFGYSVTSSSVASSLSSERTSSTRTLFGVTASSGSVTSSQSPSSGTVTTALKNGVLLPAGVRRMR